MPMPEGARSVVYTVSQFADATEVQVQVTFDLTTSTPPSDIDAAAELAMNAFVTKIEELHPEAPVYAARTYSCRLPGDLWPPAPEGA